MMNLFQLQEQLKDFSKEQLVREMQSPSGSAPPFLVMTELQRRTRMENAAALDKGPPTSTVAQDAVNAAGVPQGGIADMARSLAPQTNMAQNTGALTPQAGAMPQGAAPVQAMQEGGLLGDPLNTYAQYLDQTYSNPKIESFVSEVKGLEEDTFGQPPFGGQTPFGGTQGGGSYDMQNPPGPPPSSGMSQLGAMMGQNPVGMRSLVASGNPMASVLNGGSGAPGIRNDNNAAGNPLSTRHNLNAMVLPSVKRMQEGGLAGISRNVRDYYSQAAADMALDNRMNSDARASAVDRAPSEFYAAKAIEGRATPEDLALLDRQARSAGMETDAFIQAILNGDPESLPELGPYALSDAPAEFDLPDRLLQGQRGGGAADFTPRPEAPAGISSIGDAIARTRAAERAGEIGARRGPPERAAPERGDLIDVSDTTFSPPTMGATELNTPAMRSALRGPEPVARASAVDRAPSEFYAAKAIEGRATPEDLALLDRQARSAGMETDAFIQAILNGDPEAPPDLGPYALGDAPARTAQERMEATSEVNVNLPSRRIGTAEDYAEGRAAMAEGRAAVPSPRSRGTSRLAGVDAYLGPDFMASGPDRTAQERMEATSELALGLPGRLSQGQRGGGAADMNAFPRGAGELADAIDVSDTTFAAPASAEKPARVPDYYNLAAMDMAMDRRIGGDQPQAPLLDQMTPSSGGRFSGEPLIDVGRAMDPNMGRLEQIADIENRLQTEDLSDVQRNSLATRAATLRAINSMNEVIPGTEGALAPATDFLGRVLSAPGTFLGAGLSAAGATDLGARMAAPIYSETPYGGSNTSPTLTPAEDLANMTGEDLLPAAPEDLLPAAPTPEVLTPQAPTGPTGGGATSGATVGGMPVPPPQSAEDRMLQQDKWLALARFGAALASSQAPTFGQALGQAGQVGLDALSKARQDFLARKKDADAMAMQRAALAARTAGGGGSSTAAPSIGLSTQEKNALGALDAEIDRAMQALMEAEADVADATSWRSSPTKEQAALETTRRNRVRDLVAQRTRIVNAASGLGEPSVVAGADDSEYDVADKN